MQTATRLRFGTAQEKAATVAQIVQAYGVDIQALDNSLAGHAPAQNGPSGVDVQAEVQRALAPLMQAAQARHQQSAQEQASIARSELQEFAQDKEFIRDVRNDMADIIELAEKQGRPMTLQAAYDRACLLHPEVARVMLARQQGVNAQKLTQNAQRARSAAVSVNGAAPIGSPNAAEPSSIRESIEAAIESHSRV
jgi:hypothetical protein